MIDGVKLYLVKRAAGSAIWAMMNRPLTQEPPKQGLSTEDMQTAQELYAKLPPLYRQVPQARVLGRLGATR